MSGVVANARVGDLVFPWAADHLEPGVSAGNPPTATATRRCSSSRASGNVVRVLDGPGRGCRRARVTGKHAFVLVDFPQEALDAARAR